MTSISLSSHASSFFPGVVHRALESISVVDERLHTEGA